MKRSLNKASEADVTALRDLVYEQGLQDERELSEDEDEQQ
jgi:hypothetical protein